MLAARGWPALKPRMLVPVLIYFSTNILFGAWVRISPRGVGVMILIHQPFPLRLNLLATVFLVLTAFGGFTRMMGGVWSLVTGAPRYP